jgi:ribokinase
MNDVFVVGSINTDFIVRVDRRPAPGETLAGSDLVTAPGGKGGNQATAIARLGGAVALLARIGDDERGASLRAYLRCAGVDDRALLATPGVVTGSAIVTVTPDGENTIVVSRGANARLDVADVEAVASDIRSSRAVLAQLEVDLAAVTRSLEIGAASGVRAILNAAPARSLPRHVLSLLDPLVVNEHEAAYVLEATVTRERAEGAVQALLACGPRSVVITFGAAGAVVATRNGGYRQIDAPAVRATDTTGAGDAFTGALALELARGASLEAAVRVGVRAGAFAVQRLGAQASLPTARDVMF